MECTLLSYSILSNALLIAAILGIAIIILRHLPEAIEQTKEEDKHEVVEKLSQKGLPAMAISRLAYYARLWKKQIWNFLLETKDLRPTAKAGYQIKKIFGRQATSSPKPAIMAKPTSMQEVRDEEYFLNEIKKSPKDLHLYNELGKFYLERGNIMDAKDIYQYLTSHDPGSSEYYSRLAQCYFKLKDHARAIENYDKSLALDSTQPNRYYNKALSLESLGKYEESIESFQKAISLEQENAKYFVSLASVYAKLGQRNEAKVNLLKAKRLEPGNEEIAEMLKNL